MISGLIRLEVSLKAPAVCLSFPFFGKNVTILGALTSEGLLLCLFCLILLVLSRNSLLIGKKEFIKLFDGRLPGWRKGWEGPRVTRWQRYLWNAVSSEKTTFG